MKLLESPWAEAWYVAEQSVAMYLFPVCSIFQKPRWPTLVLYNILEKLMLEVTQNEACPTKNGSLSRNVSLWAASSPKAVYSSDSGSPGLR